MISYELLHTHINIYIQNIVFVALAKECATSVILEEEDWVLVKDDIPSITMF